MGDTHFMVIPTEEMADVVGDVHDQFGDAGLKQIG
jgi:hypothetical protein